MKVSAKKWMKTTIKWLFLPAEINLFASLMSLLVTALASGSNGNCYYVGNEQEAVLIDAGISCREIEKRMKKVGLCMQKVKAVFVSHEHSDHICGLTVLTKKYQLPVYITSATLRGGRLNLENHLILSFKAQTPVPIGNLTVHAFSKHHDAADPYSFMVICNGIKVGVFTDIGVPCEQLIHHFSQCHAAFLESNYDEHLLDKGSYPIYLKNRIRGGQGHLSNRQALELFKTHKPRFMSHLFLSHLSKNNNNPILVQELFNKHAAGVKMIVTSRFDATPVYSIGSLSSLNVAPDYQSNTTQQLQLMFD